MQLQDLWRVATKRWWVVLLVAVAAVAATVAFSRLQTPVYRATVKLTVSPSRFDYGLVLVIENMLRQYAAQLQTDDLAGKVNERLQLDLPTETLRGKVRVSPVLDEYMLQLTVDDPDPNRARDIAFVWANEFVKEQQVRMEQVDPQNRLEVALLDKPRPGELSFPRTRQYAIAALVLGLVVGAVLALLLEYLDDTIKTTGEVERHTGLALLGVIPMLGAPSGPGSVDASPNGRVASGQKTRSRVTP